MSFCALTVRPIENNKVTSNKTDRGLLRHFNHYTSTQALLKLNIIYDGESNESLGFDAVPERNCRKRGELKD